MSGEHPALIQSPDHHFPAVQSQSPHRVTELKIVAELQVTSDQVWEPATMPAMREQAVNSVIVERSSTRCTTAEGELLLDQGQCYSKEEVKDIDTGLPLLLPPSL